MVSAFANLEVSAARGAHDDGREGLVLTKTNRGRLVKRPFGSGTGVGLAHVVGSSTASAQANLTTNPDGTGTGVNISVTAGLSQSVAWTEILYGPLVGLRFRSNNAAGLPQVGMVIDGVAHTLKNTKFRQDSVIASSTDQETLWIVDDDLDPRARHTVTLIVPSDPYGGVARTFLAYGWLVDSAAGYQDPPKWGALGAPTTLNTTTTALVATTAYRKILLHNTDSVTRKVTMTNAGSVTREVILGAAGATTAPFASAEIDLGVPILGASNWTLKADAAGVVNWLPINAEVRI